MGRRCVCTCVQRGFCRLWLCPGRAGLSTGCDALEGPVGAWEPGLGPFSGCRNGTMALLPHPAAKCRRLHGTRGPQHGSMRRLGRRATSAASASQCGAQRSWEAAHTASRQITRRLVFLSSFGEKHCLRLDPLCGRCVSLHNPHDGWLSEAGALAMPCWLRLPAERLALTLGASERGLTPVPGP